MEQKEPKKDKKGIFRLFKEQTQSLAKNLVEITQTDGKNIFEKIRNKLNSDKNKEVREKIENKEWEVKEIEKSNLDEGNNKVANIVLDIISQEEIDLEKLREISKAGIPPILRSTVWKILLGLTSTKREEQEQTSKKLIEEYKELLMKHYMDNEEDEKLYHQISIDCVRTSIMGFQHVFENKNISDILNRVLYLWSRENQHINYFQGLNEILAPIIFFYLCEYVDINSSNDLEQISNQDLATLEIDSYFSLKQLMGWLENDYDSTDGTVFAGRMMKEITLSVKLNLRKKKKKISSLKKKKLIFYTIPSISLFSFPKTQNRFQCCMFQMGALFVMQRIQYTECGKIIRQLLFDGAILSKIASLCTHFSQFLFFLNFFFFFLKGLCRHPRDV